MGNRDRGRPIDQSPKPTACRVRYLHVPCLHAFDSIAEARRKLEGRGYVIRRKDGLLTAFDPDSGLGMATIIPVKG